MNSDGPFTKIQRRTADNGFIPVRATTLCALLGIAVAATPDSDLMPEIVSELLGDHDG